MDRYIEAEITGNKLTHITHTEDLFLFGDKAGGFAIQALKEVFNALRGDKTGYKITSKIDGSPSYTAASNFNGEAFVSTKGFFAKDRKIAYTPEDVDNYFGHAPDLARKLKKLLSYVSALGIPDNEIWQGDFLFDDESLQQEIIDGEKVVMFHPNTIIYAIPIQDPLARKIMRSEVGVAWHTTYRGDTYDTLKIAFDADVDKLNNLPSVFQVDSRIPGLGAIGLDKEEELKARILIEDVINLYNKSKQSGILEIIANDEALQKYLLTYQNLLIRSKNVEKEDLQIDGMKGWVALTFDKEIEKKKQPQTQEKYRAKKEEELQKIEDFREDLESVLLLQDKARQAKEFLIKKLNGLGNFRTLVKHIDQGYLPTGEEGFAISDVDGNIQKFVSRLEFSKNNFSQEIVKGWMSDQRLQDNFKKT